MESKTNESKDLNNKDLTKTHQKVKAKNIVFTNEDFVKVINNSKGNEILVFDEAGYINKVAEKVKVDVAKYWDRDYINKCIALVKNHKHKMLFMFLWRSGVRISEAINLRKKDIDFQNFTMTVKWLKSRKYNYRVVPLHHELKTILEIYTASMNLEELVFPMTRQRAWQLTKQHLKGHPHQLRHSFAVNWLRCKGDFIILHKVLGHSKIQTTMEYLKIVPIDQGEELQKIKF